MTDQENYDKLIQDCGSIKEIISSMGRRYVNQYVVNKDAEGEDINKSLDQATRNAIEVFKFKNFLSIYK